VRFIREWSVAAAYGILLLLMAVLRPTFFHREFFDTWVSAAPTLVAAIGMTLIILARHIDISIGAQFSICAVAAGLLAKLGMPMPLVAVCTVAIGGAMGAINGGLVAGLGLPSIVVTLATWVIFRQSLSWIRQGEMVTNLPDGFQWFGHSQAAGEWIVILFALAIFLVFACAMRWLAAGRAVYAVGSDQEAARLAGIAPRKVTASVFILMGALTALAALLQAVRFAEVDPNAGNGLELAVIAAVVVGGTSINGGSGVLIGTLIGVALLGTIGAALGFLSGQAQWDKAVQGLIILMAVASDGFFRRSR
jgi:rhamnose transport system permease protein